MARSAKQSAYASIGDRRAAGDGPAQRIAHVPFSAAWQRPSSVPTVPHLDSSAHLDWVATHPPADKIHPMARRALAALGIGMTSQYPKLLDYFLDQQFDYVITVCNRAAK